MTERINDVFVIPFVAAALFVLIHVGGDGFVITVSHIDVLAVFDAVICRFVLAEIEIVIVRFAVLSHVAEVGVRRIVRYRHRPKIDGVTGRIDRTVEYFAYCRRAVVTDMPDIEYSVDSEIVRGLGRVKLSELHDVARVYKHDNFFEVGFRMSYKRLFFLGQL